MGDLTNVSEYNFTTSLDPGKQGESRREYTGREAFVLANSTFSNLAAFQNSFTQTNGFWSHVGQMLSKEPKKTFIGAGKIAGSVVGTANAATWPSKVLGVMGLFGYSAAGLSGFDDVQTAANSPSILDNSHRGPTVMPVPR